MNAESFNDDVNINENVYLEEEKDNNVEPGELS